MSKPDLMRLYNLCGGGGKLHRGSILSLYAPNTWPKDHADIREWRRKIGGLLRLHFIALLDPNVKVMCVLHAADDQNRTHVAISEAINEDGELSSTTALSRR